MPTKLRTSLFISLFCTLFAPLFFPKLHLLYFSPYLVRSFYQSNRIGVLWRSIGCGIVLDFLSSSSLFGITSLNYALVSCILYGQTRNFFEDKLFTLPLMTFLFSALSTALSALLALFFAQGFPLKGFWILSDCVIMPGADALYAFFLFLLPFQLSAKLSKMGVLKKI